jgi:hypothetical protein
MRQNEEGQKDKKNHNDQQNTTQKTKNWASELH